MSVVSSTVSQECTDSSFRVTDMIHVDVGRHGWEENVSVT